MIARYSRPEMAARWSEETRLRLWLDIEIWAAEAWAELGEIPREALDEIHRKAVYHPSWPARMAAHEKVLKHDVLAFLTTVAEDVGDAARYLHLGMTSSDVVDTAFAIQLRDAADQILAGIDRLREVVARRAHEHRRTVMIGRSHGVHAEPTTFGLKLAVWYDELGRARERIARARETIAVGTVSGAVGTFANVPPEVEAYVMRKAGLRGEPAATQVVHRDRHAEYFTALALLGATVERIATELRHLQRTEVLEVEEAFESGQKGSSAMPHKRNPISSENLTGVARLLRGYALPALENVALWHERDISHSSVERVIGPDATILADYMIHRLTGILSGLVVHADRMRENLESMRGITASQQVLLALARRGVARETAYRIVQRNAARVWDEGLTFRAALEADPEVQRLLPPGDLSACFDVGYHLKHVDTIFRRVGLDPADGEGRGAR
ncbi:MAG TPA: adenylosuccinate lyase [Thermodesulfobacteriota bacterium]